MTTKLLTIFAPWPYAGNASAKSEDQRANWLRAGIAAMRLFLYLKKFCPFVNGRICAGVFGLPDSYRFATCIYPPTTAARSVMVFSETDKGAINHEQIKKRHHHHRAGTATRIKNQRTEGYRPVR